MLSLYFYLARPPITAVLRWNITGITIAGVPGVANINNLDRPYGLAFDSAKDLYVTDYGNHRIQKISGGTPVTVAGGANGVFGSAANQFHFPVHMLFDASDNLYVADRVNSRIQLWAKSATSGTTVAGMKKREKKYELGDRSLPKHRQSDEFVCSC